MKLCYCTNNHHHYYSLKTALIRLKIPFSLIVPNKGSHQFDFDLNEKDLKAVRGLIYQITGGNKI